MIKTIYAFMYIRMDGVAYTRSFLPSLSCFSKMQYRRGNKRVSKWGHYLCWLTKPKATCSSGSGVSNRSGRPQPDQHSEITRIQIQGKRTAKIYNNKQNSRSMSASEPSGSNIGSPSLNPTERPHPVTHPRPGKARGRELRWIGHAPFSICIASYIPVPVDLLKIGRRCRLPP